MIMTFETSQHAISSNIIKAMIEEYLVQQAVLQNMEKGEAVV